MSDDIVALQMKLADALDEVQRLRNAVHDVRDMAVNHEDRRIEAMCTAALAPSKESK